MCLIHWVAACANVATARGTPLPVSVRRQTRPLTPAWLSFPRSSPRAACFDRSTPGLAAFRFGLAGPPRRRNRGDERCGLNELTLMRPQRRFTTCAANSATLRAGCVILGPMPRWSAFLVGIVAAAAFVALYQLVAWWTAYVLLGLW